MRGAREIQGSCNLGQESTATNHNDKARENTALAERGCWCYARYEDTGQYCRQQRGQGTIGERDKHRAYGVRGEVEGGTEIEPDTEEARQVSDAGHVQRPGFLDSPYCPAGCCILGYGQGGVSRLFLISGMDDG